MVKPFQNNVQVIPTIVVSRPGVLQQSLRAALAAYAWVRILASAGDGLTALNLVVEHQPKLLVIDCNLLAEEVAALLAAVKVKAPAMRCLICTRSTQQTANLITQGADATILRDSPAQEWLTILRLLAQEASDHQP